jgi:hypothetical protein
MATLTTQSVTRAGLAQTFAAAAGGGDSFTPDKDTWIEVVNGGGSPITVTIVTPGTSYGLALADAGGSVTNGTTRKFGPFPAEAFADPTDGLADITYSGVTSVTVGVFKLAQP